MGRGDPEHVEGSGLDCCLFYQHHRNVVFNRVDAVALVAFEPGAVFDELDRGLAGRTGENLEQLRVDGHDKTNYNRFRQSAGGER